MKTYSGLNYSSKIKTMLKQTLTSAKKDPFTTHYLIVDDPLFFEEACFKYTDTLFNLEIMCYQDYLKKLLSELKLYSLKELSKLDKILITKQLIEATDNMFNTNSKMDLINELITIFDTFCLDGLDNLDLSKLAPLSKQKLETIIELYKQLQTKIPTNQCLCFEAVLLPLLKQISNQHIIFITDKIFHHQRFQFIKALSKNNDVEILINYQDDLRDLNKVYSSFLENDRVIPETNPYLKHLNTHLFSLASPKYSSTTPLHTLIQTTPKAQIESVVLHIYEDIVKHRSHYHDYAIYYPNQEYLDLLVRTLNDFKIPHNINQNQSLKEFTCCLNYLNYCLSNQDEDLLEIYETRALKQLSDDNYLDVIKKRYQETCYLENVLVEINSFTDCLTLSDYSQVMVDFINHNLTNNANTITLISFFNKLQGTYYFTLKDYLSLVKTLEPTSSTDNKPCLDHLYLLNYNQSYSGLLNCTKSYLVGINETIVPSQFKDTGILLDQDYQTLNLPGLNHQIGLEQNNILKVLNSNLDFMAICFANATIDGQPLLKSSLYNQLKQMFELTPIDVSKDYLHPALKTNLYLNQGQDSSNARLNTMIKQYQQTSNQPPRLSVPLFSHHLSASKLETYNSCPYKYYHQYGLKLYPFKQMTYQTNEIGTIIHYVLEKTKDLFKDFKTANLVNHETLTTTINQHVDEYLVASQLIDRLNFGTNSYIIKMIKHDLINTLIVLIKQMQVSDFVVTGSEVEINQRYPDFRLTGIVDRVDQYNRYLKIIDYKSSNKDLDISLAIQGFNIQMLVYLDTLTKQQELDQGALLYFNTKKRILGSALKINEDEDSFNYFKLYKMNGYVNEEVVTEIDNSIDKESAIIKAKFVKKDDCYKGNILSSYSFKRLFAYIEAHITKLYQELSTGNIAIAPKGSDDATTHTKVNPCTYCNYRALCNYDVFYNEYTLVDTNNLEYLIQEENKNAD